MHYLVILGQAARGPGILFSGLAATRFVSRPQEKND